MREVLTAWTDFRVTPSDIASSTEIAGKVTRIVTYYDSDRALADLGVAGGY